MRFNALVPVVVPFTARTDPTRAKCLLVHAWLRVTLGRLSNLNPEMQKSIFKVCQDLSMAKDGIDKVDNVVLPLPYCQLLKAFNLIWIYTLPFVIVAEVGTMLPLVMALIACAFFGLDSVGAELEAPFGVDPNDYPLLDWGLEISEDIDVLARQMLHTVEYIRLHHPQKEENKAEQRVGKEAVTALPHHSDDKTDDKTDASNPMHDPMAA